MLRTQIYLSEEQKAHLAALAGRKGSNVSGLIREAIASYLERQRGGRRAAARAREKAFRGAFGMWADHAADFAAIRRSADR